MLQIFYCPVCGLVLQRPREYQGHQCEFCGSALRLSEIMRKDIPSVKYTEINPNIIIRNENITWEKTIQKIYIFNKNNALFSQELYDKRIQLEELENKNEKLKKWQQNYEPKIVYSPTVRCPRCHSTSISTQKKGFGIGKAAAGVVTVGVTGALAGGVGANKIFNVCQNCGHKWEPGK